MSVFAINQDTYARSTEENTNKGTQDYLCLGRTGGSQTERIFLGFGLSALAGKLIDSATLYLYQYYSSYAYSGDCTFYIRRISADWTETAVTWNAEPATDTTAQIITSLSGNASGWRNFDISSLIQDVIDNARSFYGLALIQTDEGDTGTEKRFRSREYNTSYDAYLDISYHDMNLWGYLGSEEKRAKEVFVSLGGTWRTSKSGSAVMGSGAWCSFK